MTEILAGLLDTSGFVPRWSCGAWSRVLGWIHIGADVAVWAAYTAIPLVLAWFVRKRSDVPFPRIFWLFGAFIFCCGSVHLIEAVIFWEPVYRLAAAAKLATAVVSWATVLALLPIVPRALALPGLAEVNARLAGEAERRERAEQELRARADLLERINRVTMGRELRTAELKREVNELLTRLGEAPRYTATPGAEPSTAR